MITLVLEFTKLESDDKIKRSTFYSTSNEKSVINEKHVDEVFQSIYSTTI